MEPIQCNVQDGDLEFCEELKQYHRHNSTSSNQILPETDLSQCFSQPSNTTSGKWMH